MTFLCTLLLQFIFPFIKISPLLTERGAKRLKFGASSGSLNDRLYYICYPLFVVPFYFLGVIPHIHRYLMSKKGQPAPAQKQGPA